MASQNIYILAIESSCDDTAASVMLNGRILSNVVANQKIHEEYGGVVPELASRAHQQNIVPVVQQALKKAGVEKSQLNAIAFTRGPGLMGSLLVGTSFATSFVNALNPVWASVILILLIFETTKEKALFPILFINGIYSIFPLNLFPKTRS